MRKLRERGTDRFTIWPWYRFGTAFAAAILVAGLGTTACSTPETPEQQVRAVVAAAEDAAERRDHADLMDLVAPDFEGAHGEDVAEVSRLLRGYLLAHPSIHVTTRIDQIDFPYADMARVRLTVGMLGSDARALELSADTLALGLDLQRREGEWRVTRAEWN